MLKKKMTVYAYLAQKKLKRQFERFFNREKVKVYKLNNEDYDSHIIDDLPLTINRDPCPGIHLESQQNAAI